MTANSTHLQIQMDTVNGDPAPLVLPYPRPDASVASHWLEMPDGSLVQAEPCNPDAEHAVEVALPVRQYVEAWMRDGIRPIGTFYWPSDDITPNVVVTPAVQMLIDSWESDGFLSATRDDYTSRDMGPMNYTGSAAWVKASGRQETSTNAFGNGEEGAPRPLYSNAYPCHWFKARYSASAHAISFETETPGTWTYSLSQYRTASGNIGLISTASGTYAEPIVLDDACVRVAVSARFQALTVNGVYYSAVTLGGVTALIGDPREDFTVDYDLYRDTSATRPTIAVCADTLFDNTMALRVYPPECSLFVLDGHETEAGVIEERGKEYFAPLNISSGKVFSVFARHKTVEEWASPVYNIEIPEPIHTDRYYFHRLYTYPSSPLRNGYFRLGLSDPPAPSRPAGDPGRVFFCSPDGTGDGRTPDTPCGLASVSAAGAVAYLTGGDYRPPWPASGTRVVVYGGYSADFWERNIDKHKTTLYQTDDTTGLPASASFSGFDGVHAALDNGFSGNRIQLFGGGLSPLRDCRVADVSYDWVRPENASSDIPLELTCDIFDPARDTSPEIDGVYYPARTGNSAGNVSLTAKTEGRRDISITANISHAENVSVIGLPNEESTGFARTVDATVFDCDNITVKSSKAQSVMEEQDVDRDSSATVTVYGGCKTVRVESGDAASSRATWTSGRAGNSTAAVNLIIPNRFMVVKWATLSNRRYWVPTVKSARIESIFVKAGKGGSGNQAGARGGSSDCAISLRRLGFLFQQNRYEADNTFIRIREINAETTEGAGEGVAFAVRNSAGVLGGWYGLKVDKFNANTGGTVTPPPDEDARPYGEFWQDLPG